MHADIRRGGMPARALVGGRGWPYTIGAVSPTFTEKGRRAVRRCESVSQGIALALTLSNL